MTRTLRRPLAVMFVVFINLLGVWAAFLLTATAAQAQMACGTRDSVVEKLGTKYGETRRGAGMSGSAVIEVWALSDGTFTILLTYPNGTSCIVAAGDGWQDYTGEMTPVGDPV